MSALTRALTCIIFACVLLLCGTELRAQTISVAKQDDANESPANSGGEASESADGEEGGGLDGTELPYNPSTGESSASLLGAAPTLKTPSPVHGLCWSNSNGHFALTEQNAIFIRDGVDNRLIHTIGYDGAVSLQFAWDVVTQTDMFMALSSGGQFSVWNFNDLPNQIVISGEIEPSYSVQLSNERRVTASAFSHSGNRNGKQHDGCKDDGKELFH